MKKSIFIPSARVIIILCMILATTLQSKAQCNPSFTYSVSPSGVASFFSTSTGTSNTTQYYWNFGNGTQSNMSFSNSATTTYTTNQVYSVTLYLADSIATCFANITQTFAITNMGCNHNLVIFHAMGANGNVSFSCNANFANMNHSWAFGDGGTSTLLYPTHSYALSGSYTTTLTITMPTSLCTYYCKQNRQRKCCSL